MATVVTGDSQYNRLIERESHPDVLGDREKHAASPVVQPFYAIHGHAAISFYETLEVQFDQLTRLRVQWSEGLANPLRYKRIDQIAKDIAISVRNIDETFYRYNQIQGINLDSLIHTCTGDVINGHQFYLGLTKEQSLKPEGERIRTMASITRFVDELREGVRDIEELKGWADFYKTGHKVAAFAGVFLFLGACATATHLIIKAHLQEDGL